MTEFDRHYRSPALRWAIVASYLVILAALVAIVVANVAVVFVVIVVVAGILGIGLGVVAAKQGGVQETSEGIVNRRLLATRHWSWAEIEEVKSVRSRVFLVLRSGMAIPVIGIAQGYRVTWSNGETRDIVGVLNERLGASRTEQSRLPE